MTLKQLEYFLAIAENGSITKAANSLRISQPPLSLQLKGLEEELGCQLFIRDKKNMIITPKGILLRERAREIMDKVNETLLLMQSANEEERYTIHLGTISSICNRVLPDKVLKLKERYPHVEFVLHEGSTTSILDMLADGTVDFGIVREPFNVGAYSSRPIRDTALGEGGQDYFTAIGKPNFFPADDTQIVALTSLQDTPIIIHRRYYDLFTNACRRQGFIPNIICQNDNMISINAAVEVDLFGQVCAESVGTKHMSGSGGQIDYVRGACQSRGGKSFIAFTSTAKGGTISKIKSILTPGAVVTTSKNDVDYIVTEYGVAHLRGRSLGERARQLIAIAHPDFRDELTFEAKKRGIMI